MFPCFRVSVPLCKAKINHINHVLLLLNSNQEVIWFHVSMDEVVVVQELDSLDHLLA